MALNLDTLEHTLSALVADPDPATFVYDLLRVYAQPKAALSRLQKGDYNQAKRAGVVLWKQKVYFRYERHFDPHGLIDAVKQDADISCHRPRFLIVTDFKQWVAVDTKTQDTLDIAFSELPLHFDFFLPWAGMEKVQFQTENPADVKAAERMGRLYDLIHQDNPDFERHALNMFLSRLLFCFFAEDTGIFQDGQFSYAVGSHTAEDGHDLSGYLQKLFRVLALRERGSFPVFLQAFPYVNGGLFADDYPVPHFSGKARRLILECGALNWKAINPDIFGSMIQAVVHDEQRSHMGMHYTSVVNIMKVIEPLFLNELQAELEKATGNEAKLTKLLDRLYHLRIFDPACGSGNFLIIAYKALCQLEIEIFRQLQALNAKWKTAKSGIRLTQFYGIELDDFAHETAKLSLWLAEHQMNMAFREVFGDAKPTLPLQSGGNIVCGNATRLDWAVVCPKDPAHETYILGNPPYLGARMQNAEQKADLEYVFKKTGGYKNLDYVSAWFFKLASFIKNTLFEGAFVSTNSICQGEQVDLLWSNVLSEKINIRFAHQSFKWENNAKGNAGVTCVIVCLSGSTDKKKKLYVKDVSKTVKNINAYLLDADNFFIERRTSPLSKLPPMPKGNMPYDGGFFSLTVQEKESLILNSPESKVFIKKMIGAKEFIQGIDRWCIWIDDEKLNQALDIPLIKKRIDCVRNMRLSSTDASARKLAERAHQFREINIPNSNSIIIPSATSERRDYIPMSFLDDSTIVTNLAFVIYDAKPYVFAVISSLMHMTWVRTVAGRLKTDYRYSSSLCYNTFPFPAISEQQKATLEDHVFNVLDEREKHPEKTMAQLYDPDKMPPALLQAHQAMDRAVEQCYRPKPFTSDEERLEYLFKLYEEMVAAEKAR